MGELYRGSRYALQGFALVTRPGVRLYVVIPLIINIVLFIAAIGAAIASLDYAITAFDKWLDDWPAWIQWFMQWFQWLIWLLFVLFGATVVFFSFSIVANIVASPFNGMLAEAVECRIVGGAAMPAFSWSRLPAEFARTLRAELRKLVYIGLRALPLFVITLIPGIQLFAPFLWFAFGAWMLSIEYIDCPLGNHGLVFPRVLEDVRARRSLAFGFGATMTLLTVIPVVNFVAMPVGVAGATKLYCDQLAPAPGTAA